MRSRIFKKAFWTRSLTTLRIINRLKRLGENPIPSDSKFIGRDNNEMVFRYRIGKFRALYKVKEAQKIILVTKIDKRDKVYD